MAYHCFSVTSEKCPFCFEKLNPSCAINYYFCNNCVQYFRLALQDVSKRTNDELLAFEAKSKGGDLNAQS